MQSSSLRFFMPFLENRPPCTNHISLIFYHMKAFLYILETSKSLLKDTFGFTFIELTMFIYHPLRKNVFLLTFRRTYNVLACIIQLVHFLNLDPTSKL